MTQNEGESTIKGSISSTTYHPNNLFSYCRRMGFGFAPTQKSIFCCLAVEGPPACVAGAAFCFPFSTSFTVLWCDARCFLNFDMEVLEANKILLPPAHSVQRNLLFLSLAETNCSDCTYCQLENACLSSVSISVLSPFVMCVVKT